MALMSRTNPASLGSYYQAFLSKNLIDRINETLKLNDLAQQVDLPKNIGSTSVKFFQFDTVLYRDWETDRKSTRLNSSHSAKSRMPSSA